MYLALAVLSTLSIRGPSEIQVGTLWVGAELPELLDNAKATDSR